MLPNENFRADSAKAGQARVNGFERSKSSLYVSARKTDEDDDDDEAELKIAFQIHLRIKVESKKERQGRRKSIK